MLVRGRCLPHMKHDMVVLAEKGVVKKGDPDTLDLYRSPSCSMAVLVTGLLIGVFYSGGDKFGRGKAFAQVRNDGARVGKPLHIATGIGYFEARNLGKAGALQQVRAVFFVILGVTALNGK